MNLKKYLKRLILIICILIWLMFIFGMSAKTGEESAGLSLRITRQIYKVNLVRQIIKLDTLHTIIRKCAHFTEYGILAILVLELADTFDKWKKILLQKRYVKCLWWIVIFCIIVAASDEFHQSFVPDRGPSIRDVCIDTSGSLMFLVIAVIIKICRLHRLNND